MRKSLLVLRNYLVNVLAAMMALVILVLVYIALGKTDKSFFYLIKFLYSDMYFDILITALLCEVFIAVIRYFASDEDKNEVRFAFHLVSAPIVVLLALLSAWLN